MITRWLERISDWMEREYATSTESLALLRIVFSALTIIFILPVGFALLDTSSSIFHPPPGLPRLLFSTLPGAPWLYSVNIAALIFATTLMVGWHTRLSSIGLGVALMLAYAAKFSTGKVDHTIMIVIASLLMAFSDWGSKFSADAAMYSSLSKSRRAAQRAWSARSLALLAIAIGLLMSTSGIMKIYGGWLWPDTSATLGHSFHRALQYGKDPLLFETLRTNMPMWMWELMDWGAIFFEVGILFAVPSRYAFRWFLVIAVSFHIGVFLILDIKFDTTTITYTAFVSWAVLLPRMSASPSLYRWASAKPWLGYSLAIALSATAGIGMFLTREQLVCMLPEQFRFLALYLPAAVVCGGWVVYCGRQFIAAKGPTIQQRFDPPSEVATGS